MKNASKETLCNIYRHYYKKEFPEDKLDKYNNGDLSPAQLVNIRLNSRQYNIYSQHDIVYLDK